MLTIAMLSLWLQIAGGAGTQHSTAPSIATPDTQKLSAPGDRQAAARCSDLFESPDERVKPRLKVPAGAPPLLSFRHFEGRAHQRFSGIDLMLDDAGH